MKLRSQSYMMFSYEQNSNNSKLFLCINITKNVFIPKRKIDDNDKWIFVGAYLLEITVGVASCAVLLCSGQVCKK